MLINKVITLSTCPIKEGQTPLGVLHHNQIFDEIITFFNHDIKNLIMMEEARGHVDRVNEYEMNNQRKKQFSDSCLDVLTSPLNVLDLLH